MLARGYSAKENNLRARQIRSFDVDGTVSGFPDRLSPASFLVVVHVIFPKI